MFFQGLPEPTRPTAPCPLLSLYGIIYVTWYTSGLPEATEVRLRLPNSHVLLRVGRSWKTPLISLVIAVVWLIGNRLQTLKSLFIEFCYTHVHVVAGFRHHRLMTVGCAKISHAQQELQPVRVHWLQQYRLRIYVGVEASWTPALGAELLNSTSCVVDAFRGSVHHQFVRLPVRQTDTVSHTQICTDTVAVNAKSNKYVRLRGRPYIHTCRSCVHTPRDFTNGASLAWRMARTLTEL